MFSRWTLPHARRPLASSRMIGRPRSNSPAFQAGPPAGFVALKERLTSESFRDQRTISRDDVPAPSFAAGFASGFASATAVFQSTTILSRTKPLIRFSFVASGDGGAWLGHDTGWNTRSPSGTSGMLNEL